MSVDRRLQLAELFFSSFIYSGEHEEEHESSALVPHVSVLWTNFQLQVMQYKSAFGVDMLEQ